MFGAKSKCKHNLLYISHFSHACYICSRSVLLQFFFKALVVAIVSRHSCDGAFCCAPHPPLHPPTRLALAFISNARKSAPFTMRLFQSRGGAPPFSERL